TNLQNENEKLASRICELEKNEKIRSKSIGDLKQYGSHKMVAIPRSKDEDFTEITMKLGAKLVININRY
ncbi:MAG: hypothetical protein GY786_25125, partial [Proteobacteria bacterium]|nr:hypothetical protein [Pseudomonadota bacterium]